MKAQLRTVLKQEELVRAKCRNHGLRIVPSTCMVSLSERMNAKQCLSQVHFRAQGPKHSPLGVSPFPPKVTIDGRTYKRAVENATTHENLVLRLCQSCRTMKRHAKVESHLRAVPSQDSNAGAAKIRPLEPYQTPLRGLCFAATSPSLSSTHRRESSVCSRR